MKKETRLIKPNVIRMNFEDNREDPIDFHCPICGEAAFFDENTNTPSCKHLAIYKTGKHCQYLSEGLFDTTPRPLEYLETLNDIITNGCNKYLLVFFLPDDHIDIYIGFSLQDWEDTGYWFY